MITNWDAAYLLLTAVTVGYILGDLYALAFL